VDFIFSISVLLWPHHKITAKLMNLESFEFTMWVDSYALIFLFILLRISVIIMFFTSFYMQGDLSLG